MVGAIRVTATYRLLICCIINGVYFLPLFMQLAEPCKGTAIAV